jgi:hypothetical protein
VRRVDYCKIGLLVGEALHNSFGFGTYLDFVGPVDNLVDSNYSEV